MSGATSWSGHFDVDAVWRQAQALAEPVRSWPRARRAMSRTSGAHTARSAGQGSEFWQYRPLGENESVGRIDWRKSAQSDALLLRQQQNEVARQLLVGCDTSPSMHFASDPQIPTKAATGFELVAACALIGQREGDRVRIGTTAMRGSDAAAVLARSGLPQAAQVTMGCTVILASDFIGDAGALQLLASRCRSHQALLIAIHVHDRAECDFPFDGNIIFAGLEGEADFAAADATSLRADYLAAWAAHGAALRHAVASCDGLYIAANTLTPAARHLDGLLAQWQRRAP